MRAGSKPSRTGSPRTAGTDRPVGTDIPQHGAHAPLCPERLDLGVAGQDGRARTGGPVKLWTSGSAIRHTVSLSQGRVAGRPHWQPRPGPRSGTRVGALDKPG